MKQKIKNILTGEIIEVDIPEEKKSSKIIEDFFNKPRIEYEKYMKESPKRTIAYKDFFNGKYDTDDYIGCYVHNGHWSTFDNIELSRHDGFCEVYFIDQLGNEFTEFCKLDETITLIHK